MHHPVATGLLLALAVAIALVCAVGVAVMRDAYQRLQFTAPVVSFSAGLIAAAVWVEETDPQARMKSLLIALILFATNAILSHASARAFRVRQAGRWDVQPEDRVIHR